MDEILDLSAVDSQQLLDGLSDAIVVADERGRIVYVNRSAERLLDLPRDELVGRRLVTIIPERYRASHEAAFDHYLATREPRLIGRGPVRLAARRGDGTEVEVEVSLTAHDLEGDRTVFVGSLHDLSDRLALEHERALARYLLAMREISNRLAAAEHPGDLDVAAPVVLTAIGETLEWEVGGLWAVDGDVLQSIAAWSAPGFEEAAAAMEDPSRPLGLGEGLPGRVLGTGEAIWIENIRSEPDVTRRPIAERFGLRSCFAFPIVTSGRMAAVVEFCSTTRHDTEPDLLLAMVAAGNEIGRMIEREEARRQVAQSREHLVGMARALQASLLPPHPPVIPGLQLAARYRAAAGEGQVGGDFFDVFPLADGGWAVAIGDVSGRGPEAAALTALARYTLRAAAVATPRGSEVLRVLNGVVLHELAANDELGERFLTVAFLLVRPTPSGLAVQLACGGHPAPLVLREAGDVEEAPCEGELVGAFEAWQAADVDLVLAPGDAIVLYTDGAIEGHGPDGLFGEERFRAVVAHGRGLSAEELAASIESAVLGYVGEAGEDDMAILVLRLPSSSNGAAAGVEATALTAATPAVP